MPHKNLKKTISFLKLCEIWRLQIIFAIYFYDNFDESTY